MFVTITIATCHCGAGCVLGNVVGELLIYTLGGTINGSMFFAASIVGKSGPFPDSDLPVLNNIHRCADTLAHFSDFVPALVFGIVF